MDAVQGAQPVSSPLSSLSPTPPPAREQGDEPARKRPRLAAARPPSPADFVPAHLADTDATKTSRVDVVEASQDADEVDMTAASANVASEGGDGSITPQTLANASVAEVQPVGAATGNVTEACRPGERDDSGVGWLPGESDKTDLQEEAAEVGLEDARDEEEEIEFDGDDIWLGFDDADVGFDQPATFPSSALIPASNLPSTTKGRPLPLAAGPVEPRDAREPRLEDFGFANFDPAGGFVFATRKPFAISERALQRARALLDAPDEADVESHDGAATSTACKASGAGPSSSIVFPTPARPTSAQELVRMSTPAIDLTPAPASSPVRPKHAPDDSLVDVSSLGGFQNAAGRNLKLPSEGAMKRAREKLEVKSPSPTKGSSAILRPARPRAGSRGSPSKDVFAIGAAAAGAPVPRVFDLKPIAMSKKAPPITLSPVRAKATSGDPAASPPGRSSHLAAGSPLRRQLSLDTVELSKEPQASVGTTETGQADGADSALSTVTLSPTALPQQSPVSTSVTQSTRDRQPEERRAAAHSATASRVSGFRPPLRAAAGNAVPNTSTPARAGRAPSSTPFKLPGAASTNPLHPQNRRLSFGLTPQAKPFHLLNTRLSTPSSTGRSGSKAFVTPFKGGKRPEGLTPMGLKGSITATALRGSTTAAKGSDSASRRKHEYPPRTADIARREKAKVFDLEAPVGLRHDLTFGMCPQTHYYEHLEEIGVPKEILDMDSRLGATFSFPGERGVDAALAHLRSLVEERMPDERDLISLAWVKNHWALVLWKLASYVRSRPDLLHDYWSFERVMDQLRYRYEREINRAERSAIKRIQEHDSPASLPMVLCVSQIRWEEPADAVEVPSDGGPRLVIAGLELTDGWYRIRANVDGALRSACERGKLVIGTKLAVSGAKLDTNGHEGTDVLQALNRSQLVISGNSTSLAPWYAKLGFCKEPFIAGLGSLSANGGVVPLLDIVVERVFPCGYIDLRKGRGTETWGEDEELSRAEEWKTGRQRIEDKLAEELQKEATEEDVLVELLQEAAEGLDLPGKARRANSPAEEPDEILDRLESAANKRAIIRQLDAEQVQSVLLLAQENAQASRFRTVEQLQKELADRYPPRDVRGFRVLRVVDAREGKKSMSRSAQLTVWDAQTFEGDFFRQGQRYLVSNLVSKGSWRSSDREISLTTRRDTRWKKL